MTHNTPAQLVDKALAARLARLRAGEHEAEADGDYDTADLDQACGNAFRARQLITLAEAQDMVAAETERCAALIRMEIATAKANPRMLNCDLYFDGLTDAVIVITRSPTYFRAAAAGTKEGE